MSRPSIIHDDPHLVLYELFAVRKAHKLILREKKCALYLVVEEKGGSPEAKQWNEEIPTFGEILLFLAGVNDGLIHVNLRGQVEKDEFVLTSYGFLKIENFQYKGKLFASITKIAKR